MKPFARFVGVAFLLSLVVLGSPARRDSLAQQPFVGKPQWIWSEDSSLGSAPDGSRFFRKTFTLDSIGDDATLNITADNVFLVWINGVEVGNGDDWARLYSFKIAKHLKAGENVIAVEGRNQGAGAAGLLVELRVPKKDKGETVIVTDPTWKTAISGAKDWNQPKFSDVKWAKANVMAPLGEGPWGIPGSGKGPTKGGKAGVFTVPAGFKVETHVPPYVRLIESGKEPIERFMLSLVNMCFDAKGRIFASQNGGPILLCSHPRQEGEPHQVSVYCSQVTNCHGMCWVKDSLYLVGNGPQGTGLYRCRDTKNADRIDEVKLIAKFNGGMGEHGPHAVVHGPDNKLYVVVGNHSWLVVDQLASNSPLTRWPKGQQGPDQSQPGTTEDVLLKRQNDANGHAAGIRAPGGTVWRMDLDGKNPALVGAGFRNQFDVAFNPDGELFSFDSDMEWDEGLPWYRPVRVCHVIPGADFGWRTGSSKMPPYAEDTMPPTYDTGRGSPTGVEFYDHHHYPNRYRGTFFMCDWSIGVLWAIHLKREGGTYRAEAEKFCSRSPMPISDCAVGPDGAVYFTLGGRGTEGGIYQVVYTGAKEGGGPHPVPQPLAAWSEQRKNDALPAVVLGNEIPKQGADARAQEVMLAGITGGAGSRNVIVKGFKDADALVRRRACEAAVRQELELESADLKPLLNDADRTVRAAARLALQRIDPKSWATTFIRDANDRIAHQAIISLCKMGKANDFAEPIFERLHDNSPGETAEELLEWLRTIQLALVHISDRPDAVRGIAVDVREIFPHKDHRVNRESAIVLAELARIGTLKQGVVDKLMNAMLAAKDDRPQQIHFYYCLRVIKDGWTTAQKMELLTWYENTRSWSGGASYTRYLENILREMADIITPAEQKTILEKYDQFPMSSIVLLSKIPAAELPSPKILGEMYLSLTQKPGIPRSNEMRGLLIEALGKHSAPEAPTELRRISDADASQRLAIARQLAKSPSPENFSYVVRALEAANGAQVLELVSALAKMPTKPKPDDGTSFRTLLMSARRVDEKQRWQVVLVLRHWTNNKQFGAKEGDAKSELTSWSKWFAQSFPMQPSLPDIASDEPQVSKYKYDELLALIQDPVKKGDPVKGKVAFEKALCFKCHRFGTEGEGLGPDLTAVVKRFKRPEMLESIYYPSKVISDQYRSTRIRTMDGKTLQGLLAPMGDTVTILQSDGTKAILKDKEIEHRFASLVSVMPEKLLDALTKEEIVDLFAFMETEPKK